MGDDPDGHRYGSCDGWLAQSMGTAAVRRLDLGATFALARLAAQGGAEPVGIAFWQAIVSLVLMFSVDAFRRKRLPVSSRHLWFYAVCGALGTAMPGVMFYYVARHLPAGAISIVLALVPMMTFALAILAGIDRLRAKRVAGVALGLCAVMMLILPSFPPSRVEVAIFLLGIVNIVAYSLFIHLVTSAEPVFAGQIGYIVMTTGIVWGIILFGEAHSHWIWAAPVVMIAGLALVSPRKGDAES